MLPPLHAVRRSRTPWQCDDPGEHSIYVHARMRATRRTGAPLHAGACPLLWPFVTPADLEILSRLLPEAVPGVLGAARAPLLCLPTDVPIEVAAAVVIIVVVNVDVVVDLDAAAVAAAVVLVLAVVLE